MSANKYADLPDIDTAPDVYETEDVFPSAQAIKGDDSDEEAALPGPARLLRGRNDANTKEDIDSSNLMDMKEASKMFRKAERRRGRVQTHYVYPPSPTSPSSPTGPGDLRSLPLLQRLRTLQSEISALEVELADPSNPLLAKEIEGDHVDPGELIRGLVDVKARLDKIRKTREGRGKLVNAVLNSDKVSDGPEEKENADVDLERRNGGAKPEARSVLDIDRRVGELEKVVGSSRAALDESSPLPPPLLPLITRLNAQLSLLTQPRHIDSISRRLKLLLSDLDRASAQPHSHRRNPSQPPTAPQAPHIQEQIFPLLSRLGPSLPQIPHILTRLRTLSALHTSAAEFQETLRGLEEEQRKTGELLIELEGAVNTVEKSLEENRGVVRGNVTALESRVELLLVRLDGLDKASGQS